VDLPRPRYRRFPTDHEPMIEVRPAVGRFDDLAAIAGTWRPDARGWLVHPSPGTAHARRAPGSAVAAVASQLQVYLAASKRGMALRILSSQTVLMAQVDPYDDEIERFVVHRYAYDPARRERRNMIVAAFDNSLEFEAAIHAAAANLRRRRESGEDVDSQEHVSGIVLKPGYHRKQQGGRIIKRAIERGATLDAETWDRLGNDLPPGMAVVRFESDPHA